MWTTGCKTKSEHRRLRKLSLQGSKKEKQGPEREMLNKNKTSQTRLDR